MTTELSIDWYGREKQLTVARALLDMLTAAEKADVPPLRWTVNLAGWSLHGEPDQPFDDNPKASFDAWVDFLGMRVSPDGTHAAGSCPAYPNVPVGIHNLEHP
ncbi:hypothetical protein [Amycolatopsis sp. H20-H5]|uniref:hypothetical protein n=1 Tax=Amycolatopsis sp. H20-H5 TaxID=3046309 RepID=UPI002DBA4D8E|nr:hypothetical protein [Amycolatopsis sp. H20-H5]MEC3976250.1 hypothetical protein [Amycolatopsis sp. H20-H5]